MLEPLTEINSTVCVLIGMCSQQLLQGRGTYTALTELVHMVRFGSVWTLRGCVDMPCLLWVPWWQSFIPYLMEVLSGFPLSLHLFLKHLVIEFRLQMLHISLFEFHALKHSNGTPGLANDYQLPSVQLCTRKCPCNVRIDKSTGFWGVGTADTFKPGAYVL